MVRILATETGNGYIAENLNVINKDEDTSMVMADSEFCKHSFKNFHLKKNSVFFNNFSLVKKTFIPDQGSLLH